MQPMNRFTEGKILLPLVRFALPVLLALFLQAMYGAVDLLIVGKFAKTLDISAVATGSQLMHSITTIVVGLSTGLTVLLGQKIGEGRSDLAGRVIGTGIVLFSLLAIAVSALGILLAPALAQALNAPIEAFEACVAYLRICCGGTIFIVAFNVLGSIFRGIGDSNMPLITVAIACACNIVLDLLFVAVFHMGAAGAAWATVIAQALSVLLSLLVIKKRTLPFTLHKSDLRLDRQFVRGTLQLGIPIALQELLVGISFLVIHAIVNALGLIASAGVGVAEKLCGFIMLIPSAFMHSMSAFVAQNIGAMRRDRARKALLSGVLLSLAAGISMFYLAFFHGDLLSWIFAKDLEVIAASFDYLKAYAVDCLFTCFLFCFMGYFNGVGSTVFVMAQGIIGAFLVRIPVAFFMSRIANVSLFLIGLATPASTVVQITLCLIFFVITERRAKAASTPL